MEHQVETDTQLKRYLLGELTPEESGRVEERLFLDGDYFQHFKAAEDELIDEYLYGDLSADEQVRFEGHFLKEPGHRESLRVARALRRYLSKKKSPDVEPIRETVRNEPRPSPVTNFFGLLWGRHPALASGLSLAAGLLLLVGVGLWLTGVLQRREVPEPQARRIEPLPSPTALVAERDANDATNRNTTEQPQPSPPNLGATPQRDLAVAPPKTRDDNRRREARTVEPAAPVYVALLIPGGAVRGEGELQRVPLPHGKGVATFQLSLLSETKYLRYRVKLLTGDDHMVKRWTVPKPTSVSGGRVVSVSIPAERLRAQTYKLTLAGVAADGGLRDIATYHFQVEKSAPAPR